MKSRLQSTNFLANVITMVFIALNIQGIDTTLDPGQTATELLAGNWAFINQLLIPWVWATVFKLIENIKAGLFSWRALFKSPNFLTAAITVVAGLFAMVGIILPETASVELTNAILSGSTISIIVAVIVNVANPLWHFIQDLINKGKKTEPAAEKPAKTAKG